MTSLRDQAGAFVGGREVVIVSGADAVSYLQGQVSQDIEALAVGESAWSLVLEPQGKLVARFRITRRADDLLLDLEAGFAEVLVARLERFRLRVDVAFEAVSWTIVSLRGPAGTVLPAGEAPIVAPVDWVGVAGVDLVGPDVAVPDGLRIVEAAALEALRIESGVAAMGSELVEGTIAAEAGVVDQSVSFTKGCYTGQELVARIDSRGSNTPRRLRGIVFADGEVPAVGTPVVVGADEVGAVTSAAYSESSAAAVALGYVRRGVEPPAEATIDGRPARIVELPILAS